MKILILLAVQCALSFTAIAQNVDADQLKKALGKYRSLESLETTFKQTKTLKDIQIKLESEGTLKVLFPNKVEWKVSKPQPLEMILDQDTIRIDNQTFRASEGSSKDQRAFRDLLNWLRLDADALLKDYEVRAAGKNAYRFAAKNSATGMKALEMKLDGKGHVESLTFEEIGGDQILIRFGPPKLVYRKGA